MLSWLLQCSRGLMRAWFWIDSTLGRSDPHLSRATKCRIRYSTAALFTLLNNNWEELKVGGVAIKLPESFHCNHTSILKSRGSSVGTALGCGLDDRGSMVRFRERARNFSLHHRVQNGPGAHPDSYPIGTRGSFPGSKAAGAWSSPLTSI
jgi:hypothetical protein